MKAVAITFDGKSSIATFDHEVDPIVANGPLRLNAEACTE
jgi:hypothetical protein